MISIHFLTTFPPLFLGSKVRETRFVVSPGRHCQCLPFHFFASLMSWSLDHESGSACVRSDSLSWYGRLGVRRTDRRGTRLTLLNETLARTKDLCTCMGYGVQIPPFLVDWMADGFLLVYFLSTFALGGDIADGIVSPCLLDAF